MKTVLLLSILLWAASAAPAEDTEKAPEAAVDAPQGQMAAAFAPVSEEAAEPESRHNICPDGWFSHGSRCFMFSTTAMNWSNAEEHCNSLGAHLASSTNSQEYSFLQRITRTAGQSIIHKAWLGGFNLQGRWMWIDRQGFYYTNWHSQYPSSSNLCLYLSITSGWINTRCSSAYRFICSKNAFGC